MGIFRDLTRKEYFRTISYSENERVNNLTGVTPQFLTKVLHNEFINIFINQTVDDFKEFAKIDNAKFNDKSLFYKSIFNLACMHVFCFKLIVDNKKCSSDEKKFLNKVRVNLIESLNECINRDYKDLLISIYAPKKGEWFQQLVKLSINNMYNIFTGKKVYDCGRMNNDPSYKVTKYISEQISGSADPSEMLRLRMVLSSVLEFDKDVVDKYLFDNGSNYSD